MCGLKNDNAGPFTTGRFRAEIYERAFFEPLCIGEIVGRTVEEKHVAVKAHGGYARAGIELWAAAHSHRLAMRWDCSSTGQGYEHD
jgi:hypothetical protein